jgi:hypothetical protein
LEGIFEDVFVEWSSVFWLCQLEVAAVALFEDEEGVVVEKKDL